VSEVQRAEVHIETGGTHQERGTHRREPSRAENQRHVIPIADLSNLPGRLHGRIRDSVLFQLFLPRMSETGTLDVLSLSHVPKDVVDEGVPLLQTDTETGG